MLKGSRIQKKNRCRFSERGA